MLAQALRSRALARLAVAALAIGLIALAGLALWSTDRTERDAARLGEINEIAAKWGRLISNDQVLSRDGMEIYRKEPRWTINLQRGSLLFQSRPQLRLIFVL